MERTEMESLVKQLKAAGLNEEQIMETFFETFQEGKMDRADLESLAKFMGYELTDGFKNDATPDPIAGGAEGGEGEVTKSEAEELKEIKPGESKEEFEQKVEAAKEGGEEPQPAKEPEGGKPEGEEAKPAESEEDKGWKEAQEKLHW